MSCGSSRTLSIVPSPRQQSQPLSKHEGESQIDTDAEVGLDHEVRAEARGHERVRVTFEETRDFCGEIPLAVTRVSRVCRRRDVSRARRSARSVALCNYGTFQVSDLDFGQSNRLAQVTWRSRTLFDRPKPDSVSPTLQHQRNYKSIPVVGERRGGARSRRRRACPPDSSSFSRRSISRGLTRFRSLRFVVTVEPRCSGKIL